MFGCYEKLWRLLNKTFLGPFHIEESKVLSWGVKTKPKIKSYSK